MSIKIQPLIVEHFDEARQVWETCLGANFQLSRLEVIERMQNGAGIFLIAVDDEIDRIVGVKFGYFEGAVCIGRGIGVLPDYRRRGIAARLIRRFEQELRAHPEIKVYAFGSATTEGIPFHLAMGYSPQALIQFTDQGLRAALDLSPLTIRQEDFNAEFQVYQIYADLAPSQANLDHLRGLQDRYPQVNLQFFFEQSL